jgi:hypothetical protein
MANHGMDRPELRQGALDGGDELDRGELVARRLAVRRHIERDGGKAARHKIIDDGRELRTVAFEAMDQQHGRPLAPAPGHQPVAEIEALVGESQRQAGRRPDVAARIEHQAAEERCDQRGHDMACGREGGDGQRNGRHAELQIKCSCTYLGRARLMLKRRSLPIYVTFLHAHGFPAGPPLHAGRR